MRKRTKYSEQQIEWINFCIKWLEYHYLRIKYYTKINKLVSPNFIFEWTIIEYIYLKIYRVLLRKAWRMIEAAIKHEMSAYINRIWQICEHIKNIENIHNKNIFIERYNILSKYEEIRHNYSAHRALDTGSNFNWDFWLDLTLSDGSRKNNKGEIIIQYKDKERKIEKGARFEINVLEDHQKILKEIEKFQQTYHVYQEQKHN